MTTPAATSMPCLTMAQMLDMLKSLGEGTRLRILALLRHSDLAVGELVEILCLSQPRLSHHMKSLTRVGLVTRLPEGSWVFYRITSDPQRRSFIDELLTLVEDDSGDLARDRASLNGVRQTRNATAEKYFSSIAEDWDRLRALQSPRAEIEAALRDMAGAEPFTHMVDIGTATGRMLTLFADRYASAEGLDLSHKMLTIARANLEKAGISHASVRQGDALAMPFADASADLVTLHKVLHFVDQPERVLREVARILAPNGRALIADFAPHDKENFRTEFGHRRLGISQESMQEWVMRAGLSLSRCQEIKPPENMTNGLSVYIWSVTKPL